MILNHLSKSPFIDAPPNRLPGAAHWPAVVDVLWLAVSKNEFDYWTGREFAGTQKLRDSLSFRAGRFIMLRLKVNAQVKAIDSADGPVLAIVLIHETFLKAPDES